MDSSDSLPRVSVIIPARNEARNIGSCLAALRGMNYPSELMDVVVVDNGSTDSTVEIAKEFGVPVVAKPLVQVGAVRNEGVRVSTGAVLAFLDADCVPESMWLYTAVRSLNEQGVGAVGGGCVASPNGSWIQRAWADLRPIAPREVRTLPGASIIICRETFDSIGRFNECLTAGEDDELCYRVRASGLKLLSHPNCCVTHLGYPDSLMGVARRQIWHGTHQLYVAESPVDIQLLLTHCFLAGIVLGVIAALLASLMVFSAAVLLVAAPVLLLAYKKSRAHQSPLVTFFQMIVIGAFFYTGRAIGLVMNYLDAFRLWRARH